MKSLPYLRGLCMVSRTLVPQPFILHVHPLPSLPNFLLTLPGSAYKCSPTPNLTLLNGILSLSRHGLFVQKGSITPRARACRVAIDQKIEYDLGIIEKQYKLHWSPLVSSTFCPMKIDHQSRPALYPGF